MGKIFPKLLESMRLDSTPNAILTRAQYPVRTRQDRLHPGYFFRRRVPGKRRNLNGVEDTDEISMGRANSLITRANQAAVRAFPYVLLAGCVASLTAVPAR